VRPRFQRSWSTRGSLLSKRGHGKGPREGHSVRIPKTSTSDQVLAHPPVRHPANLQTRPLPASVSGKLLSSPSPTLCPTPWGVRVTRNAPSTAYRPAVSRPCREITEAPTCASVCGIQPWVPSWVSVPLPKQRDRDVDSAATDGSTALSIATARPSLTSLTWRGLSGRLCPGLGSCVTFAEPRWRHSRAARPLHPFNFFRVG
jgi:hypothetical protein